MSGWHYRKDGVFQSETVGPLDDAEMLQLCFDGKVSEETLVLHPVRTKGQWATLGAFAGAIAKIAEGKQARAEQREADRQAAAEARAERQRVEAERRASAPWGRFLLDGQSEAVVLKILEKAQQFVTPDEQIEYIAIQARPVTIAPDSVVLTSQRVMVFRPTMLGKMEFEDFWWVNLSNAHVKEGMLFSTFTAKSSDGRLLSMDYLPKAQAAAIYRGAQHREMQAHEQRRQLDLEHRRAGAGGVSVSVNSPTPSPAPTAAPQSVPPQPAPPGPDDPVAKLSKLKQMLDAGLISQDEYDATKMRILGSL